MAFRGCSWVGTSWFFAGVVATTASAGSPPLVTGVGPHNPPPYAMFEGSELKGGLIHDLAVELARRLDRPANFVDVARKRIGPDLGSGAIDLYCGMSPGWIELPPEVHWSPPLFVEQDVFLMRAEAPPIDRLEDLRGRRIGTVLGYRYTPSLEALFANGTGLRDDAQSLTANMERLGRGWIDAVLDSDLAIAYQRRIIPDLPPLVVAHFVESANQIHCIYADKPDLAPGLVNPAFSRMIADGTIAAILGRYR